MAVGAGGGGRTVARATGACADWDACVGVGAGALPDASVSGDSEISGDAHNVPDGETGDSALGALLRSACRSLDLSIISPVTVKNASATASRATPRTRWREPVRARW